MALSFKLFGSGSLPSKMLLITCKDYILKITLKLMLILGQVWVNKG